MAARPSSDPTRRPSSPKSSRPKNRPGAENGRNPAPEKGKRADPVRRAVAEALVAFQSGGGFRSDPPQTLKEESDRRLYVQLLRGVVRHWRLLESIILRLSNRSRENLDPVLGALAAMGLYQLKFLKQAPHAAVFETVALAPTLGRTHGKGWLNGVLRSAQREDLRMPLEASPLPLALRTSHPDWLVERWSSRFGAERTEALCEANNQFEGAALRVETRRISVAEFLERLAAEGGSAEPHPLLPGAVWTEHLGTVLQSQVFRQGLCYVQDVASQLLLSWVGPRLEGWVLDACAAPGGKLTQLAGMVKESRFLVGADISQGRLRRVRENLNRLRLPSVPLLLADGHGLPFPTAKTHKGSQTGWDAVLLDVPCSATGMIRKYPELKWRKHPEDIPRLAQVQRKLLAEATRVVRPGGLVIYSTCSLEGEENEAVVEGFLMDNPGWRRVSFHHIAQPRGLGVPVGELLTRAGDLFVLPEVRQMGLYAACLEREP
ncbi:MAG: 16S rRNA (cytosine(967)-C(5))-methyltransferase RsmB [Deltaproteobacteria bacterium]|nr:16S rRNA (cytosine(967)-C(5))-methyltransferase RsmB [Deltaproteobacteria bacterium]